MRDTNRSIGIAACDLSRSDQIAGYFAYTEREHGPVDILVNNAGTTRRAPAHELSLDDWKIVLDVNLTAAFAMSQAFAQARIAAKQPGKIINIGSLMSSTTRKDNAPVCGVQGGILLLTKALAVDWAPHRILVNGIWPWFHQDANDSALGGRPRIQPLGH